ncbi:MAG: hypothetical protein ACR2G9_03575, partial [Gaiellaceae bacterium]
QPRLAVVSAVFVALVALVVAVWLLDPVYGMRTVGAVAFLVLLYAITAALYAISRRRKRDSLTSTPGALDDGGV